MKKAFIITGIIMVSTLSAFAADVMYSNIFINKFIHCLPAAGTATKTDEDGNIINIQRGLHGWKNGVCRYSETVTSNDTTKTYNCNLSREQVNELASAMKADPTDEGIAKQTWDKFKKIPEVCTETGSAE